MTKILAIAATMSLGLLMQVGSVSASDDLLLRCNYGDGEVWRMKPRASGRYKNPVFACGQTRYVSNSGRQAIQARGCHGNPVITDDGSGRKICSF